VVLLLEILFDRLVFSHPSIQCRLIEFITVQNSLVDKQVIKMWLRKTVVHHHYLSFQTIYLIV